MVYTLPIKPGEGGLKMLIRDLEKDSGLDRATIRYYEKEGFIRPSRQENGYREYSQEDLDQLLKIKLLRKLGVSLETIRKLQQGTADFSSIMDRQIRELEEQVQYTSRAIEVCRKICEEGPTYQTLNASFYLDTFNKPIDAQPAATVFSEHVPREYHPVRRYLARVTDYSIATTLALFLLIVVFRVRPFSDLLSFLVTFSIPFLMVPIQAFMLHRFGTTPGKWLFGLRVLSENGCNLGFSAAKSREWEAFRYGFGYGIPLWSIYCLYKSYREYQEEEPWWDRSCEYRYEPWNAGRKATLVVVLVLLTTVRFISSGDQMLPKHRGELSISEFASNYNYYYTLYTEDSSETSLLQPDGTWYPEPDNSVVIYIDGKPEKPEQSFTYQQSNGVITGITYSNTWTDIFALEPVSYKCVTAALTTVMSQKGMSLRDLFKFANLLDAADKLHDGSVNYGNVTVQWFIEAENCIEANDFFMRENKDMDSKVSVRFEILIA